MKKFLALVLLFLFFAYNTYTYHQLSSAEGAYKLAGIPSSEKLIAAYHDNGFWQFATYNPKTRKLKVYAIYTDKPILPWGRDVKSVKTPLNYSPLALNPKLLEKAPKETPALLFAGKWYTRKNPPKFPTAEQIAKEYANKTLRELTAYHARKELWIGGITIQTGDAIYGAIGSGGVLVIPDLKQTGKSFIWEVEIPIDSNASKFVVRYLTNMTVRGIGIPTPSNDFIVTNETVEKALSLFEKSQVSKANPIFLVITLYSRSSNLVKISIMSITTYQKGISMMDKIPRGDTLGDYQEIPINNTESKSKMPD
ncbi:hypothetical protein [Thermococcus sp. AM4]|uniref:hypothetical protein n=1 Tax=Thermococcus sp. (strain AM4) TaxID=246969 RepID=UPI0001871195|nr:hypothetical protein [Thermococcus sp. AM4]EEB74222.1 hypothetical protein TAM4_1589 [Thermococcus sp. AM4]